MTNPKRRRQTRTRLTTGYPPELHNTGVQLRRAYRLATRALILARREFRQLGTALAAFHAPVAVIPARRSRVPGCDTCWQADAMTPHHDASPTCGSGGRDHCTCDTCY